MTLAIRSFALPLLHAHLLDFMTGRELVRGVGAAGGQFPTKIAAALAQRGGQTKNDWSKEMSIHRGISSVLQSIVTRRAVVT